MQTEQKPPVAFFSVFDKRGILEFGAELVALGFELWASSGSAATLSKAHLPVQDIANLVGEPILGHRVVTLSREVHAGLLATNSDPDIRELEELGLRRIELVYVNLYPLKEEIAKPDHTRESVIEKTDIGGPTLLRSAAKGRRLVVTNPDDMRSVLDRLAGNMNLDDEFLDQLAATAEAVAADYALTSARHISRGGYEGFIGHIEGACKYGENGWQGPAMLYSTTNDDPLAIHNFDLVRGGAPSYNNYIDIERLLQTITHIAAVWDINASEVPFIAVGAKHGNPCGAATSANPAEAIKEMVTGDTRAIFGGLVMTNLALDEQLTELLLTFGQPRQPGQDKPGRRILDGVIAPGITPEAADMLKRKGDKCRVMVNPALAHLNANSLDQAPRFRYVRGGFLTQPNYTHILNFDAHEVQTFGDFPRYKRINAYLAWAVGATSNSNTITLTHGGRLIGNGTGQQDRVGAAKLAIQRARDAKHSVTNTIAYSDSFFPFPDGVEVLADAGVNTIIASSGSINDKLTIEACQKRGVTLVMIPDAIGRGFFGH